MKIFFRNLCVCLLSLIVFVLIGCQSNLIEEISNNVSETRENFYVGEDENFFVTFTDGRRETDFVMNGKTSPLVPFGVIVMKSKVNLGEKPSYILKVDNKEYSGNMEINPFDMTYVADIEQMVGSDASIQFILPAQKKEITLNNISNDWQVTCSQAFNIFVQNKEKSLSQYYDGKKLKGEVFIKIVSNQNDTSNICYYVLFVAEDGNTIATLIDTKTGEILQT